MIVLNILTILPEEVSLRVVHFLHREKNSQYISFFDPVDDSIEQDRSSHPIESVVSIPIFQLSDS